MQTALTDSPALAVLNPNTAIITTVIDQKMNVRHAALLYNSGDDWFNYEGWGYTDLMAGILQQVGRLDASAIAYQSKAYTLRNGIYQCSATFEAQRK